MLFFKLKSRQAAMVHELLGIFEQSTGQKLSSRKSSLLVREGVDSAEVQEIKQVLDIVRVGFEDKYLGLPMPTGRFKRGRFSKLRRGMTRG
jgi:hypothetical protein